LTGSIGQKTRTKKLEADVKAKRTQIFSAKKAFKELRKNKTKGDRPARAEVQDILEKFDISAAAYHGGDLNGVCACRLIQLHFRYIGCNNFKVTNKKWEYNN
jgi:hypothetical protein